MQLLGQIRLAKNRFDRQEIPILRTERGRSVCHGRMESSHAAGAGTVIRVENGKSDTGCHI